MLRSTFLLTSALVFASGLAAQAPVPKVEFPAPSPAASIKQRVGLTDFEIVYSRPSMKGRQIFGGIEAYGRVWRTGANNATKIKFSTPVKFNGTEIPAGSYELFSIPDPSEWTVIIAKDSSQWGAYTYDAKNDVARIKATPVKLPAAVETFTIEFSELRDESATLNLLWETTRVPVKLELDVASTLVPQIEAAMAAEGKKPAGLYFQAAGYYYNHNLDLKKALTWIETATNVEKPAFYMVHLKARILAKMGDKAGAKAAAAKSKELAIAAEGAQSPFIKQNDDLVSSL